MGNFREAGEPADLQNKHVQIPVSSSRWSTSCTEYSTNICYVFAEGLRPIDIISTAVGPSGGSYSCARRRIRYLETRANPRGAQVGRDRGPAYPRCARRRRDQRCTRCVLVFPECVSQLRWPVEELRHRSVRIFQPTRNTMQSGSGKTERWRIDFDILPGSARWENPLMGWASS